MGKISSFEDKIYELENIIASMESGELSLEESLKLYESGMELAADCEKILKRAQLKLETIRKENMDDEPEI